MYICVYIFIYMYIYIYIYIYRDIVRLDIIGGNHLSKSSLGGRRLAPRAGRRCRASTPACPGPRLAVGHCLYA